jgi:hypothetical protein
MSVKKMILISGLLLLLVIVFGAVMVAVKPSIDSFKFGQACGQLLFALWVLQWLIWYLLKTKKGKV